MMLQKVGARAVVLHSILKQKQRFSSLEQFKSHKARILVATDVASRGLDLPNVAIVVNHNVPGAPRNYVHRVGRTARAGRKGLSITMVSPYDTGTKVVISREPQTTRSSDRSVRFGPKFSKFCSSWPWFETSIFCWSTGIGPWIRNHI